MDKNYYMVLIHLLLAFITILLLAKKLIFGNIIFISIDILILLICLLNITHCLNNEIKITYDESKRKKNWNLHGYNCYIQYRKLSNKKRNGGLLRSFIWLICFYQAAGVSAAAGAGSKMKAIS